ncbi:Putative transposase (identified by ISEscan HMM) [Escherichia coli]|nr:Putative transposase (identified by ISEscan HMM) [Escherichia coli]
MCPSPDYSCISKRAKTVEIKYRLPSHGPVAHGHRCHRTQGLWRRRMENSQARQGETPRLAQASPCRRCGDPCHRCSRSQPETVGDNEVLPTLLPLRRKIEQVSADGAYDTKACYALLQRRAPRPPYRREKCGILEDRPSTQRGGCRAQGRRTGAMEKGLWLSSALDS